MINNDETRTAITTTPETATEVTVSEMNQAPQETPQEDNDWRKVVIGGVTGIVLGAAGAYAAQQFSGSAVLDGEDVTAAEEAEVTADNEHKAAVHYEGKAPLAHSVNDEMSFGEAFAAARKEVGAGGVFEWRGNLYGTYYEKEWENMSAEDKKAYWQSVRGAQHEQQKNQEVQAEKSDDAEGVANTEEKTEIATKKSEEHETTPEKHDSEKGQTSEVEKKSGDEHKGEDVVTAKEGEVEVALLGHEVVRLPDGSIADMGAINVNGHDAVVVDIDMDGNYDIIGADLNGDGQLSGDELAPLQPGVITADDFDGIHTQMASDDNFTDVPDYNNDGDFNTFV